MAKRNALCKKTVDLDAGTVKFTFSDDDVITFDLADLDAKGVKRSALHGISQKGGDSYAGVKTVDEAKKILITTLSAVEKGDWTTRTPGEPRTIVLVAALARAAGKTEEEAQAVIDEIKNAVDSDMTEEENADRVKETLKALNNDPAIKKAKLDIASEKLAKEEKTESVIGGLF